MICLLFINILPNKKWLKLIFAMCKANLLSMDIEFYFMFRYWNLLHQNYCCLFDRMCKDVHACICALNFLELVVNTWKHSLAFMLLLCTFSWWFPYALIRENECWKLFGQLHFMFVSLGIYICSSIYPMINLGCIFLRQWIDYGFFFSFSFICSYLVMLPVQHWPLVVMVLCIIHCVSYYF